MQGRFINQMALFVGIVLFPRGNLQCDAVKSEERGALVLAFDDGFSNWLEVVAPELRAVGGTATAFVNNQYVPGRIRFEELRRLRDEFGWEIGTHGFHHHNARAFVRRHGLDTWEREQLAASIAQFADNGLDTRVFAFPFNDYSPELAGVALQHIRTYRRAAPLALARTPPRDGSHPATSIDIAAHVPVSVLEEWVDAAARTHALLFLYAHRILPDEAFVRGVVQGTEEGTLIAEAPVVLPPGAETWMLVPDVDRRLQRDGGLVVRAVEGRHIRVADADLAGLTRPGATFMIGPASATRLSDFRALLQRARDKNLRFLRVGDTLQPTASPPETVHSSD